MLNSSNIEENLMTDNNKSPHIRTSIHVFLYTSDCNDNIHVNISSLTVLWKKFWSVLKKCWCKIYLRTYQEQISKFNMLRILMTNYVQLFVQTLLPIARIHIFKIFFEIFQKYEKILKMLHDHAKWYTRNLQSHNSVLPGTQRLKHVKLQYIKLRLFLHDPDILLWNEIFSLFV